MTMGNRIKERRKALHMTQDELGEKLGVQKSAVAKWENGRVENIKRSVIQKMATILECSPVYLMGWEDQLEQPTKDTLTSKQKHLLSVFDELNDYGQDEAIKRIEELAELERYKKGTSFSDAKNVG